MWDWLASQIDTFDLVVLTGIIAVGLYFYLQPKHSGSRYSPNVVPVQPSNRIKKEKPFMERLLDEKRQVVIMYGSQTGTAEELSGRLAKDFAKYGQKALVIDPENFDTDDLARLPEVENCLLIMCMATYGEGDPTDNAQGLYEYIMSSDMSLTGVHFAVFGLGNKTYEHFNAVGKNMDKKLEELGATRAYHIGLGDDDANLEEDFMRWREGFLPKVAHDFTWELDMSQENLRQYRLELIEKEKPVPSFHGEMGRLNGFEKKRAPFDAKNPFPAEVAINKELHSSSSVRNCAHIEFDIHENMRYETGDHLAVYPNNDNGLIDKLQALLDFDPDQLFRLINLDETSSKRHPFPCPTTFREAFKYYVDICQPVKSHVLKAISECCTNEDEKAHLLLLSTASEEGLKEYNKYISKERRAIVDVLIDHPSCKPPVDFLLELLPRLQVRYYSIASSPKVAATKVAICAVVTRYTIGDRDIKGVCTNYLLAKNLSDPVAMFIRKSTMRMPHKLTTPMIMIGPGTGFAPFRGFIQERAFYKENGRELGEAALYFGCRRSDEDYIYQDEIEDALSRGVLTKVELAFSRQQEEKVYVQHRLWATREYVWELLKNDGYIYVCGDARNMARDVQATLLRIITEVGKKTSDEANQMIKDFEKQRRYQADVWS